MEAKLRLTSAAESKDERFKRGVCELWKDAALPKLVSRIDGVDAARCFLAQRLNEVRRVGNHKEINRLNKLDDHLLVDWRAAVFVLRERGVEPFNKRRDN